jgi:hypothetical protein
MMRALCLSLAIVGLGGGSAFGQTDVSGEWEVTVQSPFGGGPNTVKATMQQDGEKLTGSFRSQTGEVPVIGTITGDDLRIGFTMQVQGTPLDITMSGKVDAASIAGKAQFGPFGEVDWTAKRVAAADTTPASASAAATDAAAASACAGPVGTWAVTLKTPGGDYPFTATLAEEDGKISGTFTSQLGEMPVNGTLDGKSLKLAIVAKTPQGLEIPVTLTGDLDGESIANGKAEFGGLAQGEWTAKCKP